MLSNKTEAPEAAPAQELSLTSDERLVDALDSARAEIDTAECFGKGGTKPPPA